MLNTLTQSQNDLKSKVKNEWLEKIDESTEINEEYFAKFISYCYTKIKKTMPKLFIANDPLTAVLKAKKMGCKDIKTIHYFGLGYDSGWLSYYDYFNRIGILKKSKKIFEDYLVLEKSKAFAFIFLEHSAIAIRRPLYIKRDNRKKMHCENGPAIEFLGGNYKSWRWHGVCVTEQLIMRPETITKEQILTEKNSEVSRAIAERLGWDEYLKRVDTILVHKWFDETTSSHYELFDFKERKGSLQPRLLKMESPELNDGTKPYYIEPVPPQTKTCQAGRRWQCDPSLPKIEECNENPNLVFEVEA